jgi:hypothetical protein
MKSGDRLAFAAGFPLMNQTTTTTKKIKKTDIFTIGGGDGNLEELLFGGFGFGFLLSSPPKLRT